MDEGEPSSRERGFEIPWSWILPQTVEETRYLFILSCLRDYLDVAPRRLSCMSAGSCCVTQRLWKHRDLPILKTETWQYMYMYGVNVRQAGVGGKAA
jgi:hypothetical protein